MIKMPPDTKDAVWLTRITSKGAPKPWVKHYILAYNDDFMFRIYNRADGVFMANVLADEFSMYSEAMARKILVKKQNGYAPTGATWSEVQECWQISSETILPSVAGRPLRVFEPMVKVVCLEHSQQDKDYITLELMKTKTGKYRLDQYETAQDFSSSGFPLWQTLFSDEEKAQAILREVIQNKKELGYIARNFDPKPPPVGIAAQYPLSAKVAKAFKGFENGFTWF